MSSSIWLHIGTRAHMLVYKNFTLGAVDFYEQSQWRLRHVARYIHASLSRWRMCAMHTYRNRIQGNENTIALASLPLIIFGIVAILKPTLKPPLLASTLIQTEGVTARRQDYSNTFNTRWLSVIQLPPATVIHELPLPPSSPLLSEVQQPLPRQRAHATLTQPRLRRGGEISVVDTRCAVSTTVEHGAAGDDYLSTIHNMRTKTMTTSAICFSNPGTIDHRAFTMLGLSAKEGDKSKKIGFFGTGFKYALAVLLRENHYVQIVSGEDTYTFSIADEDFRGTLTSSSLVISSVMVRHEVIRAALHHPSGCQLEAVASLS